MSVPFGLAMGMLGKLELELRRGPGASPLALGPRWDRLLTTTRTVDNLNTTTKYCHEMYVHFYYAREDAIANLELKKTLYK